MTSPNPKLNAEGWEIVPRAVHTIKMPVMIEIPAGEFLMGTSDENITLLQLKESDWAYEWSDNDLFIAEQPQHLVSLPSFEIAKYPVTNAEYQVFISDVAHRLPRSWTGFTFPEGYDNHPVAGVSKTDAEAYIEWLNRKTGMNYGLPTEAEWERAARGSDGRIYPWGNTFDPWRCNTAESVKKGTTPIDFYSSGGDSPCGAVDMVGNVWEWTRSPFLQYPCVPDAGEVEIKKAGGRYVIRGGAWYYSRKLARCAAREGILADYLSPSIGFRLARPLDRP
ncbi:formylglycine-generating enzyme family protein [Chloroflexi bacterium CFX6]|nr:formylglycine-generating enzyme family protein [Chloroflexi bacterium CFX6]